MKRELMKMGPMIGLWVVWSACVAIAAPAASFPPHWGEPPRIQTHDYVQLPGGYGHGSSTLANWIKANLEKDQRGQATNAAPAVKPIYENHFDAAEPGKIPEEFLVLNGSFAVRAEDGNKFLEVPGAPADDYALLFGPSQKDGVAVSVRAYGTPQGRRFPVLAVGLNGLGGYELQLAPAKKALELFKGDERVASVACTWTPGAWTRLRLQVRKVGDALWKIEGKAWAEGTPEPAAWMITHDETTEPPNGRPLLSGHPFSGTPIRFDDLVVTPVK